MVIHEFKKARQKKNRWDCTNSFSNKTNMYYSSSVPETIKHRTIKIHLLFPSLLQLSHKLLKWNSTFFKSTQARSNSFMSTNRGVPPILQKLHLPSFTQQPVLAYLQTLHLFAYPFPSNKNYPELRQVNSWSEGESPFTYPCLFVKAYFGSESKLDLPIDQCIFTTNKYRS